MALDKYLLHLQLQSHLQLQLQSQCPTQSSREDRFKVATWVNSKQIPVQSWRRGCVHARLRRIFVDGAEFHSRP